MTGIRYSKGVCNEICSRIAEGESLRRVCEDEHMPACNSVMRWLGDDSKKYDGLRKQYVQARSWQVEYHVDRMLDIVKSEEDVNKARLMIDVIKWTAGKMKPKKYGDIKVEGFEGDTGQPLEIHFVVAKAKRKVRITKGKKKKTNAAK